MKYVFALLAVAMLTTACGSEESDLAPNTGTNTPTSPTSPTTPGTTGIPWTSQELQSTTNSCAQSGNASYTAQQWRAFCGCVYGVASTRWTLQDFATNFYTYYNTLDSEGTIANCLRQAGMSR